MEIFQTIWTSLTTPNIQLINIISIPLTFLEGYLQFLIFSTVLNIFTTKKQKVIYVILTPLLMISCNFLLPQYSVFLNMIFWFLSVIIILRISILKGIIALILPSIITALLDSLIAKFALLFFNVTREQASSIPIYRISFALTIYLVLYIMYKLIKHFKFSINLLDNINKKKKAILICNSLVGCIAIATQFYLIGYYNEMLPFSITILSLLSLITYFLISIYSLTNVTQLQITEQSLEEAQLYNKSLKILHDNVRAFKHDFSNIVQAIGRLCWNK